MTEQQEQMTVQQIDREIVGLCIDDILAHGWSLGVCYERGFDPQIERCTDKDEILKHLFACDEEWLLVYTQTNRAGKPDHFVYFIYGESGWDVMCDYSTALEPILKTANPRVEFYSNRS